MFPVKNGCLPIGGGMPYIRFGGGKRTLIMLPGLGDGLKTVRGMALPFALLYRVYTREYTVYSFSRPDPVPADIDTRRMADETVQAMDMLHIDRADVLGVSMGGMIAQHMAAAHPGRVGRLVLAVTAARANPLLCACVGDWADMARRGDHRALLTDNIRRMYTDAYFRRSGWTVPLVAALTKPRSYDRFLHLARACVTHDAADSLKRIAAPTLVIGGGQDRVTGADASRELAEQISGAQLHIYPALGHSAYEEAPDFHDRVLSFFTQDRQ